MTEAGWYRGEGDPPGTQRYWNGNAWVGDPVYEPTMTPAPPPPTTGGHGYAYPVVATSTFPTSLKVVAIVVTVLKAIPLALATILVIWLAVVTNSIDEELDDWFGLAGLLGAAIAFLVVMILVGGLLLGFQFAGALKERPIMLFIPALIMTVLDVLFLIGAWSSYREAQNSGFNNDDSVAGIVLMVAVTAAQGFVAVQAIRANSN